MRSSGQRGRDYAGISSEKTREKRVRRKSKVSWGRLIRPGLVDPKLRPKGVSDGQCVNIRTPAKRYLSLTVTQEVRPAVGWMWPSKPVVPTCFANRDEGC